ncbi:hypothetical protein GF402_03625 [Candidatus Fermentibacteria bacterium]|nr:hypothetical protein [Candidatus Fermentibacteria bacterium]
MSTQANKEIVRRWIEEGWNGGDVGIVDELYHPDFTAQPMLAGHPELRGSQSVKDYVLGMRAAFPDLNFTIKYLIAEDDYVAGAFRVEGTHKGTLFGIPATGKTVDFEAVDIWRFRDDRIVERPLAVADFLHALQQMGLIPQMG